MIKKLVKLQKSKCTFKTLSRSKLTIFILFLRRFNWEALCLVGDLSLDPSLYDWIYIWSAYYILIITKVFFWSGTNKSLSSRILFTLNVSATQYILKSLAMKIDELFVDYVAYHKCTLLAHKQSLLRFPS